MTQLEPSISIAGRRISRDSPPYIIAEISANHNGSIEVAKSLIKEAYLSGADAVKLQTYRPDTITLDCDNKDFQITEGLWAGKTLYELYNEAHMPWEWHSPLFEYARELGITIFSSPFDFSAVDLLEELDTPAYKIASFEAVDIPLVRYVAETGKPMIISTGMASAEEIEEVIEAAISGGCKDVAILRCVSGYPAPPEDYHLKTIVDMRSRFGVVTGLSDHTLTSVTAIASIALGAAIIEKHFTLNRKGGGPDDCFSIEPKELRSLCQDCVTAWEAVRGVKYGPKSSEKTNLKFRRSLYFIKDMEAGDTITRDAIKSIRPGFGLPPRYFDQCVGLEVVRRVSKGTPVSWHLVRKTGMQE